MVKWLDGKDRTCSIVGLLTIRGIIETLKSKWIEIARFLDLLSHLNCQENQQC